MDMEKERERERERGSKDLALHFGDQLVHCLSSSEKCHSAK